MNTHLNLNIQFAVFGKLKMGEEEEVDEANWVIGEQVRNKGSIHKDLWMGPAVDLANRNKIAVFPVGGWWMNRKKLERYNEQVRYSLIVTIEAPENLNDIDIYTPVIKEEDIPDFIKHW